MSSRRRQRKKKTASPTSQQKGSAISNANDDGTQVDTSSKKKTVKRRRRPDITVYVPTFRQNFRGFVLASIKNGVPGLLAEFEEIQKQTQAIGVKPKTAFDAKPDKNRYKDVYCIDESRVKLEGGGNDYIHANWIELPDKRRYICTQGPLATTINDFWRMVWQEKCKYIVMLCNLVEGGQKKCEEYWPESGETKYGELTVKVTFLSEFEKVMTVTHLTVTKEGGDPLEVEHILWGNWPERGVPSDVLTWQRLFVLKLSKLSPTVVHCTDGIGRSGTLVGMDMIWTTIKQDLLKDGKEHVLELRARRHGAVQTDMQYLYIYRALIGFGLARKAVKDTEVKHFIDAYNALCKQRGYQ